MKLVSEFVGTFFLVLTVGLTALQPGPFHHLAPLAIGLVLAVMVYANAHLSGAHFNPAVTFAMFLRGKASLINMLGYWIAQVFAAVVAAMVTVFIKGSPGVITSPTLIHIFIAEALYTFALCHVVLHVATAKEIAGNSFFGFAIGSVVTAGAYSVGPISGAAFNPSVALAVCIMGLASFHSLWAFIVAQLIGAAVAVLIFKLCHPGVKGH